MAILALVVNMSVDFANCIKISVDHAFLTPYKFVILGRIEHIFTRQFPPEGGEVRFGQCQGF